MGGPPRNAEASIRVESKLRAARVAVIIPVHKPVDEVEAFVLAQNVSVLSHRSPFLLCPRSLDVSDHMSIAPSLSVVRVPDALMGGWRSYCALMVSLALYRAFDWAEYILVLQLDAIVFTDDIDKWTGRGFDYVGPPWFTTGPNPLKRPPKPAIAGGGGVSLRRTESFIRVLEQAGERRCGVTLPRTRIYRSPKWKAAVVLRSDRSWVATRRRAQAGELTEDQFWAMEVPRWFEWRMPSALEALRFAFDLYPQRSLDLTHAVPFAVHGRRNVETLFAVATNGTADVEIDEYGRGDPAALETLVRSR